MMTFRAVRGSDTETPSAIRRRLRDAEPGRAAGATVSVRPFVAAVAVGCTVD